MSTPIVGRIYRIKEEKDRKVVVTQLVVTTGDILVVFAHLFIASAPRIDSLWLSGFKKSFELETEEPYAKPKPTTTGDQSLMEAIRHRDARISELHTELQELQNVNAHLSERINKSDKTIQALNLLLGTGALHPQDAADGARVIAPVTVSNQGVEFGYCWISHEKITGFSAERLNEGDCSLAARKYVDWLRQINIIAGKEEAGK